MRMPFTSALLLVVALALAPPAAAAVDERRFLPPARAAEVTFDGVVEALVGGHTLIVRRDDGRRVEVRLMGLGAHDGEDPGRAIAEGLRVRFAADPARRDPDGRLIAHAERPDGSSLTIAIALARAGMRGSAGP